MYNRENVDFVEDRFGNPNSAIRFNGGSYQVPPGVYFNGDFTISLWIKSINDKTFHASIFDFGNFDNDSYYGGYSNGYFESSSASDNIQILTSQTSGLEIFTYLGYFESHFIPNFDFFLGQWTHFVYTLNGTTGTFLSME